MTQNIILFLLGVPAQIVATQRNTPLGVSDYVLGSLAFLTVATEFVADNQQYSFQTYKRTGVIETNEWPGARIQWTPQDAERGFVTRGLWAWSRLLHPLSAIFGYSLSHPVSIDIPISFANRHSGYVYEVNYKELSLTYDQRQLLMCFIPILSSPRLPALHVNAVTPLYPLIPGLVLCTLFFSSTIFTESISKSKYPITYAAYQSRVAMFVPILTPVWGLLLQLRGKKEETDAIVYGSGKVLGKLKAD